MAGPRRPSLLNRTMSTPPSTPNTGVTTESKLSNGNLTGSVLTPPTSPRQSRSSSNISELSTPISAPYMPWSTPQSTTREAHLGFIETNLPRPQIRVEPSVIECPFDIEILKDEHGRDVIFGTGAWST